MIFTKLDFIINTCKKSPCYLSFNLTNDFINTYLKWVSIKIWDDLLNISPYMRVNFWITLWVQKIILYYWITPVSFAYKLSASLIESLNLNNLLNTLAFALDVQVKPNLILFWRFLGKNVFPESGLLACLYEGIIVRII